MHDAVILAIGALVAYGQWHLLAHVIVPRLSFEDFISVDEITDADGRARPLYRVRLRNKSKFRSVIDVEATSVLRIPHYDPERPRLTGLVDIPLQDPSVMRLGPRRARYFAFLPGEIPRSSGRYLPEEMLAVIRNPEATLHELLGMSGEANLRVYAAGFDAYSGARRVYFSREYRLKDLRPERYPPLPRWINDLTHGVIKGRRPRTKRGQLGHGP